MASGGYKGAAPTRETSPEQYPGVWELTEQFQAQADGNWPFQETDCAPRSLRFNSADSAYLSKTPTAAGNRKTWTWSGWVKRSKDSSAAKNDFFGVGGNGFMLGFDNGTQDVLRIEDNFYTGGLAAKTVAVFRDYSAWYHIVLSIDTTQASSANGIRVWVNNELQTLTSVAYTQNYETLINSTTVHFIGGNSAWTPRDFNGYLADVHFIDGQALEPTDFGFYDGQGIWQPKRFTGDYSSGPVYSNFGDTTNIQSSYPWSKAFDGIADGSYSNGAGAVDPSGWARWTPPNGISVSQALRINTDNGSTSAVKLKFTGQTVQHLTSLSDGWNSVTGTGTLEYIEIYNSGSTWSYLCGVEIDGVLLTDASVGRNSFHLDFSDSAKDQSGLGNDWTANNLGISGDGPASSLAWESGDSGWTIASGGGSATEGGGNSYQDVFTGLLEVGKIYAFTTSHTNGDQNGGWFFSDSNSTSLSGTHPNQGRGSNSIGQRGRSSGHSDVDKAGAHGTFATANGVSAGDSNLSGFTIINPEGSDTINWVVDRVKNKVWVKRSSDSAWIQGGNPSDGDSAPSFHLPSTGNLYFGFVQYNNTNFTISIAAYSFTASGRASDIFVDSPVNGYEASTGAGGERRGNYCCLNPLDSPGCTLTNGNLNISCSSSKNGRGTVWPSSGKWYFEFDITTYGNPYVGIGSHGGNGHYVSKNSIAINNTGHIYVSTNGAQTYPGYSVRLNAIGSYMCAFDLDNGKIWWGKDGTWYKQHTSANATTTKAQVEAGNDGTDFSGHQNFGQEWTVQFGTSSNTSVYELNTGQRPFKYPSSVPSGYSPLATSFLPEPAIKRGDEGFDVKLWSGDNAVSRLIKTSLSPDLAWIKVRNAANTWHHITDIVRGTPNKIYPNDVSAEDTAPIYGQVDSFDTDGFTVGDGTHASNPLADVNQTGINYVGYAFDAGDATTTIAAGSLNSSVYDQSQTWSSSLTSTQTFNLATTRAFDGDATNSTLAATANATNANILFTKTFTNVTKLRVYMDHDYQNYRVRINNGTWHTDSTLGATANAGWRDLTSIIPANGTVNSIESDTGGQNNGVNWSAVEVNGRLLVDQSQASGKTVTRLRFKTDWNWMYVSQIKINGSALTTGTLDNSGSVWSGGDNWKNGSTGSGNETYSQSARGDWFDVTLASNIANFSELEIGVYLDSSAGSTTNIFEIQLFFSDNTSYTKTYASASDAPNQANYGFNGRNFQNFGDLGPAVPNLPSNPSTVRARPEVGFSIIKYVGDHDLGTSFAHGLNKKPDMIVVKNLDSTDNWAVYHSALGATKFLDLNRPDGANSNTGWWYGTEPTSSVFYTGNASTTAGNIQEHIAFAFSEIEGYSKFTSFTGTNGDVFVYLGFRPRLIWFKNADATANWLCYDTARNPSNPANFSLQLDEPNTDTTVTNDDVDILSNGFNIKATRSDLTGNGNQIIVAAWAEHPFASQARAR
jgi:hypothetical protein